jgi:protein TonB
MQEEVIFRELPETFPPEDKYQKPSTVASIVFHVVVLAFALLLPLLFPSTISKVRLLAFIDAPSPPPSAPVVFLAPGRVAVPPAVLAARAPGYASELMAPVAIPENVARIIDAASTEAVAGETLGVLGGMPDGIWSPGTRGVLESAIVQASVPDVPPPPPPAPPPAQPEVQREPVRFRDVNPFRITRSVPPVYPPVAKKAHIQGEVVLEVTVLENGEVHEVRVTSGHPMLVQSALDSVRQWIFEPPRVDGRSARVIIPVHVNFRLQL